MEEEKQKSRMERDVEAWKRIEDKLIQRYGSGITKDRSFLKAKRDIYKHIADKNKRKRLNLYEKAELRVIRGQHRNLLRQLYPNPYIRLIRNTMVFAGNLLNAVGTFGFRAAKWLITPDRKAASPIENQQVKQQSSQKAKAAPSQNKAVIRRMPQRTRRQMAAGQSRGVRR
ncbi:hypothetical protein [Niabella sp.]|uniref:hypothetical protein n=1 Tax=Niabella sp. TaxID=1962976 RepID=UPI0026396514|nr:hypothetical protein [Niabella sp.]